jgi:DNA-directed RNA polymerase alpha subunit
MRGKQHQEGSKLSATANNSPWMNARGNALAKVTVVLAWGLAKNLTMTLESPLEALELPTHLVKRLRDTGYHTVGDLCAASEHELLHVRRVGRLRLNKIKGALAKVRFAAQ